MEVCTCVSCISLISMLWCHNIGCPALQSPDYGTVSIIIDNPQPGDTVRFTCDDGYELVGSEVRTCLETDVWSGEAVSCQGIMINLYT